MTTATEIKLGTLSYVILFVKDTEESLKLYRDKLGMTVKMAHPGWAELETGTTTLALHSGENAVPTGDGQPSIVFNVEDVHAAYETLKARGVTFLNEPHEVCDTGTHLGISANFRDLDANLLSIYGMVEK